jgi:hypothetical protein
VQDRHWIGHKRNRGFDENIAPLLHRHGCGYGWRVVGRESDPSGARIGIGSDPITGTGVGLRGSFRCAFSV